MGKGKIVIFGIRSGMLQNAQFFLSVKGCCKVHFVHTATTELSSGDSVLLLPAFRGPLPGQEKGGKGRPLCAKDFFFAESLITAQKASAPFVTTALLVGHSRAVTTGCGVDFCPQTWVLMSK